MARRSRSGRRTAGVLDEWVLGRRPPPAVIDGHQSYRPHLLLLVDAVSGFVFGSEIVEPDASDDVVAAWAEELLEPGVSVRVEDERLAAALRARLGPERAVRVGPIPELRAQSILLAVPAVVFGFAINFLFGAKVTCLAFWKTRVYSIAEFYYAVGVLFSGQFVPLELMPPVIQQIAQFLPFQLFRYFPIQLILGKLSPQVVLRNFALDVVWLLIAYALFSLVWREGVKRFSAVGA